MCDTILSDERLEHVVVDAVVVFLEERVEDYLDVAILVGLARAPLQSIFDELHQPLL